MEEEEEEELEEEGEEEDSEEDEEAEGTWEEVEEEELEEEGEEEQKELDEEEEADPEEEGEGGDGGERRALRQASAGGRKEEIPSSSKTFISLLVIRRGRAKQSAAVGRGAEREGAEVASTAAGGDSVVSGSAEDGGVGGDSIREERAFTGVAESNFSSSASLSSSSSSSDEDSEDRKPF